MRSYFLVHLIISISGYFATLRCEKKNFGNDETNGDVNLQMPPPPPNKCQFFMKCVSFYTPPYARTFCARQIKLPSKKKKIDRRLCPLNFLLDLLQDLLTRGVINQDFLEIEFAGARVTISKVGHASPNQPSLRPANWIGFGLGVAIFFLP